MIGQFATYFSMLSERLATAFNDDNFNENPLSGADLLVDDSANFLVTDTGDYLSYVQTP